MGPLETTVVYMVIFFILATAMTTPDAPGGAFLQTPSL